MLAAPVQYRNVFCAIRPPGHHAGPRGAVRSKFDKGTNGFCMLCNTAIGAAYALNMHRQVCKKVAILDFDVHHGNGTQVGRWVGWAGCSPRGVA